MQNNFIDLVHKLPGLDKKLLELLKKLSPEEWQTQTIAKLWKVKDIVAHLLDGNIRVLSMLRDNYQGESPNDFSYNGLVKYLNRLNVDWVQAMKRVSPEMLILMHEVTGKPYYEYYASLDPFGKSPFAVNWAGEEESKNWMHIAREYTEKFLHQQQIRDAVAKPALMTKEFFQPFAEVCMLALPYTFRDEKAENKTCLQFTVSSEIGGHWFLVYNASKWELKKDYEGKINSEVMISPESFWKLVSKSLRYDDLKTEIKVEGNYYLAEKALSMVSFMV